MPRTDRLPRPLSSTTRQPQATLAGPDSKQGPGGNELKIITLPPQFTIAQVVPPPMAAPLTGNVRPGKWRLPH